MLLVTFYFEVWKTRQWCRDLVSGVKYAYNNGWAAIIPATRDNDSGIVRRHDIHIADIYLSAIVDTN